VQTLKRKRFGRLPTIFQDPLLAFILLLVLLFVFISILLPLLATVRESLSSEGLPLFQEYLGSPVYQTIILNTVGLGLIVGLVSTAIGFLFAFVQVKLDVPFKRLMHIVALVPVISPPFALATATIVLFGRSGVISRGVFDVRYDIYGLDGLVIVMSLSFFTLAYLNLKGMMEALDPALDEAATNLGASKWRVFRTVTLPMLVPGIASSFLLIFVEAIADLGNPLVLAGNYEVLATRIYVTIIGLYNPTGAAVLSLILLMPSLSIFLIQRYWVSRASVVSITGKPSGTPQKINHPLVRWGLFGLTMAICALIVLIYGTIFHGSLVRIPGVRNDFTLEHFDFVLNGLGLQATQDTTLLSVLATPIAGLIGMIIAYLVVRKQFYGRDGLDFATMLGIAVPGTIIGIGYIVSFNNPITLPVPFLGDLTLIPN
jgi:iron(III) transport system permease protein